MKKITFAFVVLLPIFASAQHIESRRLGTVIAVDRTFIMDSVAIRNNLISNDKQTEWDSDVDVVGDRKEIVSHLNPSDYYQTVNNINVMILIVGEGYKIHVAKSNRQRLSREEVIAAIEQAITELKLRDKPITTRFLKIEN